MARHLYQPWEHRTTFKLKVNLNEENWTKEQIEETNKSYRENNQNKLLNILEPLDRGLHQNFQILL